MLRVVIHKGDGRAGLLLAIQAHTHGTASDGRLHDLDVVDRLPVAVVHGEPLPLRRQARRNAQPVHLKAEPQQRLQHQPVHPGSRARVPGPAAAAGMRRHRIDVCSRNVGLHHVHGGFLGSSPVVHRVDDFKELPGAAVVAQPGKGHGRPDGRMRILAAILPHARGVAFDVAGIQRRGVKGRIKQLDQLLFATHKTLIHGLHGLA